MSRKTQYIHSSDTYFHVYNRGVNRSMIYFEPKNYDYFLQRLQKALDPCELSIVAYCLMPNHFHLLLYQRTPGSISSFMRYVCDGYSKALNKSKKRTGHLFEGTYKLKPIESDLYLLHLSRYIHLNPVKSKLVIHPEDWKYSSYHSYCSDESEGIVESRAVIEACGGRAEYQRFVEDYQDKDRRSIAKFLF